MEDPPVSECGDFYNPDVLNHVPFVKNVMLVSIEHPAIVNNVDKALATLGGCGEISKTFSQSNKRIALKWRPSDVYCKAAYGERYPTTNLLMKVKKRWRKGKPEECQYKVEVIGVIDTTYKFQAMVDYQYLPVVRNPDHSVSSIHKSLVLNNLCDRREYLNNGTPLFLPPSSFSRMDYPDRDYLLRKDIEHRPGYINPDSSRPQNLIGTVRQKRTLFTQFCSYGDSVPTSVSEKVKKDLRTKYNNPEYEKKLAQLFEERPIWSKMAMNHRFRENKYLKFLLPLMAFYFITGPWRCLWCRFGFDPSKEPSAKMYQTVDFRKRQGAVGERVGIKLKRKENILQYQAMRRSVVNDAKINIRDMLAEEEEDESTDPVPSDSLTTEEKQFIYTPTTIPPCRQMFYQLCDIRADKIQHIVHRNDDKEKTCTEKDGWCDFGTIDKCRDLMSYYTMKFLSSEEEQQISMVDFIARRKMNNKKKRSRLARIRKIGQDVVEQDVVESNSDHSSDDMDVEKELEEDQAKEAEEDVNEMEEEEDVNEMETEMLDCV